MHTFIYQIVIFKGFFFLMCFLSENSTLSLSSFPSFTTLPLALFFQSLVISVAQNTVLPTTPLHATQYTSVQTGALVTHSSFPRALLLLTAVLR